MAVVLLTVAQTLDGFLHLPSQRQGMGLPPGMVQLIEHAQRLPPLLSLNFVLQSFVIDLVAVPGFSKTVAQFCARPLALLLKRSEGDESPLQISCTELFERALAKRFTPLTQPGTITASLLCVTNHGIDQLRLQAECLGTVAGLPGELGLATAADGLLAWPFPVQPTQGSKLLSIAQTGFQVATGCCFAQSIRQLLFPPVRISAEASDTAQCGDQPETREMATQRQGWSGNQEHPFYG